MMCTRLRQWKFYDVLRDGVKIGTVSRYSLKGCSWSASTFDKVGNIYGLPSQPTRKKAVAEILRWHG